MVGACKSAKERLATQGNLDSRKVWGLSFFDNSNFISTLVLKIIRSLYEKEILFLETLASLHLEEEEGEVVISHRVNDDSTPSMGAL